MHVRNVYYSIGFIPFFVKLCCTYIHMHTIEVNICKELVANSKVIVLFSNTIKSIIL